MGYRYLGVDKYGTAIFSKEPNTALNLIDIENIFIESHRNDVKHFELRWGGGTGTSMYGNIDFFEELREKYNITYEIV